MGRLSAEAAAALDPGGLNAQARAERRLRPLPEDPRVAVVVTCDGRREYLEGMLESLHAQVSDDFEQVVVVDDSGDENYAAWLDELIAPYGGEVVHHAERQGQTATINEGWSRIDSERCEYFMHVEDDFLFEIEVDLREWIYPLTVDPALVQVTLLRQPWNEEEQAAGSVLQVTPDAFTERRWGGVTWLEHRRGYFANPHVAPVWVAGHRWPEEASEPGFSTLLLAPPPGAEVPATVRMAYFGGLEDPPRVTHVGDIRTPFWRW